MSTGPQGGQSVGADRKGPLAAFVVIAIIAAVLLVTSVRSQAESGQLAQQQLSASGHLHVGVHERTAPTRAAGAARQVGPPHRAPTRASRDAARDTPRTKGRHVDSHVDSHVDWQDWLARLWAGHSVSD